MGTRLILVGAGSFGRELINWAEDIAAANDGPAFSGFLDGNPLVLEGRPYDLPWLGTPDEYVAQPGDLLVLGIADPATKRALVEKLRAKGANFARLVHPTAVVARTAVLGQGVVLCPHSLVSAESVLGDFVSVNALSSVGHDVDVGAYTTLSGHVDLTGFVTVGEGSFFGTGAKVLPNVKVGARAKIGAGATIMRGVPDDATMYILPAKRM
jgi:sugar O-acyltransferase (sialic acid O-acetyltransferase NeuD family)